MKIVVVLALVVVVLAMAGAGVFMLRKGGDPTSRDNRMARALTVRVGVSVAVFLFIMLGWSMGWIHPTGLPTGR